MRALLDVYVLIALLDGSHIHHGLVTDWLAGNLEGGWASCPITQNGCIRILSQPSYHQIAAEAAPTKARSNKGGRFILLLT
jgi:hypothetical protein